MFKNILICSFVPENNKHVFENAIEIAKKFDSNIVSLKCIHEELPTFALFHTKSEKKKKEQLTKKIQTAFDETEKIAKLHNISIKTESVFVESLSEHVSAFVNKNEFDLFIPDFTPPSDITLHEHKDIVNKIYKNIDCPILTLK